MEKILKLVLMLLIIPSICFAETSKTYYQKDKLFKIDIPESWNLREEFGEVVYKNREEDVLFQIRYKPTSVRTLEEAKPILEEMIRTTIELNVNPYDWVVVSNRERWIDGVYARQIDYTFNFQNQTVGSTVICFFNKGYGFVITLASSFEEKRLEMKRIIETLKF